ncbi:hypothetical protein [Neobacillus muris]|uniref:hypothetical protein n=1 Tax=Neobacillus muris TaxID=2941334 RepID=UPI00203E3F7F|nr:hypothetical protein [Neobacillus muris]
MSEHQQFLAEREQIDLLIGKGYQIHSVKEHLNGATVEFVNGEGKQKETLLIGNANARKYFSSLIVKQSHLSP